MPENIKSIEKVTQQLYKDENKVSAESGKVVTQHLSLIVARTHSLALKTFNYNWKLRGKPYNDLLDLTHQHYEELLDSLKRLKERIRELGYDVPDDYTEMDRLSDILTDNITEEEIINDLILLHFSIIKLINDKNEFLSLNKDDKTQSILFQRIGFHNKSILALKKVKNDHMVNH